DFTQHAETAYAEGVQGHLPLRRPGPANHRETASTDAFNE
ncbi:MAG: hypothetical protein QOJ89_5157, partial [bacterium]